MRENCVGAGADVLRSAGHPSCAVVAGLQAGVDYFLRVSAPNRLPTQYDISFDLRDDIDPSENTTDFAVKADPIRRDIIIGGKGDDALYGGGGNDTFVFLDQDGRDIIQDFTPREDRMQFGAAARSLADLRILQDGADTVIQDAHGDQILLAGVHAGDLSAGDFLFG